MSFGNSSFDTSKQVVDVAIQDQASEVIDLYLSRELSSLTLTIAGALDDTTITGDVDVAYVPSPGEYVCLKEGKAFMQSEILAVTPNGGDNYTLGLDSPLDFAFTTLGGCSITTVNMAEDGSVSPVIFSVSPALLDANVKWDITRIMMSFIGVGTGAPPAIADDTNFGTQGALTNGMVWRKVNGVFKNLFNAKTNADFKVRMFDVPYTDKNKNGLYGTNLRRSLNGPDKNGVVIRLENNIIPADADQLQMINQDDLTTHTRITAVVQGHVVED